MKKSYAIVSTAVVSLLIAFNASAYGSTNIPVAANLSSFHDCLGNCANANTAASNNGAVSSNTLFTSMSRFGATGNDGDIRVSNERGSGVMKAHVDGITNVNNTSIVNNANPSIGGTAIGNNISNVGTQNLPITLSIPSYVP